MRRIMIFDRVFLAHRDIFWGFIVPLLSIPVLKY
jgi:hypothetical protein